MKTKIKMTAKSMYSSNALVHTVGHGYVEISLALIKAGADVNARDWASWTPLILASYYGYVKMCWLLLENGADVNVKSSTYKFKA